MKALVMSAVLTVFAAGTLLQGCNTTAGFGEDMQNTGVNIQRGVKSVDPNVEMLNNTNLSQEDSQQQGRQDQ